MNEVVVDASVVVKAFVQEADSAAAGALWSSEDRLFAPAHALAEVGAVLTRKERRGEISPAQVDQIASALPGALRPLALDALFDLGLLLSRQLPHGFYDSLYLAAAVKRGCVLITADEKFVRSVAPTAWRDHIRSLREYAASVR